MSCKCEEGTWGAEKVAVCKHPVYTEEMLCVVCLNCAHDKACHEDKDSATSTKQQTD